MADEDKDHIEWMKQADYDMETAVAMHQAGRYIYSIFMCHLTIEKALKAVYRFKLDNKPPKSHDLLFLAGETQITIPSGYLEFLDKLSALSVPTRYPRDIAGMTNDYDERKSGETIAKTKEALAWLKTQLTT